MNIINEDHGNVDVIDSDSDVIGIDFEYIEDVVETVEMQVHEKLSRGTVPGDHAARAASPGVPHQIHSLAL
jgi:hypothetical protein